MSQRWRNILLSLPVALLLFASCKKNFSSDTPLQPSYSPSIIISSDNRVLYALDPTNGKKNWEYALPYVPSSITAISVDFMPSPLLYNDMIYQADVLSDTIYKINSKTGALVKKIMLPEHAFYTVISTPIADGGLVYVATMNDSLYAFDTGSYTVKWKFGAESPIESSPVIYNGQVYISTVGGHVYAVDKTSGPAAGNIPTWDWPGSGILSTAKFVSSPAVAAPYLYVGSISDSNMYCIHLNVSPTVPNTGELRWTYKTKGAIYSSPATIAGRCIFGSTDFHVYCLDTTINPLMGITTPHTIWVDSTASEIRASPYVSNQVVYIPSYDNKLYAFNIIDGGYKWTPFKSNGLIKSSPLVYNGTIYVGSYDKNLYALDSATGTLKWSQNVNGNIESSPVIDNFTGTSHNSQISGFTN